MTTLPEKLRIQKYMLESRGFETVAVMLAHSDQEGLELEVNSGRTLYLDFPGNGKPMTICKLPVIRGYKTGILVALPKESLTL